MYPFSETKNLLDAHAIDIVSMCSIKVSPRHHTQSPVPGFSSGKTCSISLVELDSVIRSLASNLRKRDCVRRRFLLSTSAVAVLIQACTGSHPVGYSLKYFLQSK